MEKKQKFIDPIRDLKENPEKLKSFLSSYPEPERDMVEKVVEIYAGFKANQEEIKAQSISRKARAIEKIRAEASKQSEKGGDPFFLLEMTPWPNDGVVNDEIYYYGAYTNTSLIWHDIIYLRDKGTVSFHFPAGLPVGTYAFYTDWYVSQFMKKIKIRCTAHPWSDPSAVVPQGSIDKYTEDPSDLMFSGAEMIWTVVSANDSIYFCIRNMSGYFVSCFGAYLLGIY